MIKKLTGYLFFLLLPTLLFSQNIQTVGEPADTLKQAHIRVDTTLHVYGNTILDGNLTMNTIATEQVKLGTGSDAAPELSSVGDTNTGIRFPGGDKMQFVQNGLNSHTFRPYQYTLTYSDGDTLGIYLDGTATYFKTKTASIVFNANNSYANYYLTNNSIYYGNDVASLGLNNAMFQYGFISDTLYVGKKGQSAAIKITTNSSTSQKGDSCVTHTIIGGYPVAQSYDGNGNSSWSTYCLNGQMTNFRMATQLLTIGPVAAATDTCLNIIPAGCMVVGVTTRVTTAVTGDAGFTGFSVGDGTDLDRWGANLNPAKDETSDLTDCTITSVPIYSAATSVILTQVGGSSFATGGVVRVTVHYISLTAPNG